MKWVAPHNVRSIGQKLDSKHKAAGSKADQNKQVGLPAEELLRRLLEASK